MKCSMLRKQFWKKPIATVMSEQNCLFVPSSNPKNTNIYKSVINVRLPKAFLSSTQVDTLKFAIIPLNAYAIIQKLKVCSIILIGFLFGKGNTFQLCVLVVKIFPNVMVAVEKHLMCTMVISMPQTHCLNNHGGFLYLVFACYCYQSL